MIRILLTESIQRAKDDYHKYRLMGGGAAMSALAACPTWVWIVLVTLLVFL